MNKRELIKAVVEKKPYRTRASEVEEIINKTLGTIQEALSNGNKVNITGFGAFEAVERKAREGRNPRTGAVVDIPASTTVKFRVGKKLKDALN